MKKKFQVNLQVTVLKEDDCFIAYSPALDISTVGDTLEEAQRRFAEAAQLFLEEITLEKKLEEALLELGWQKEQHGLTPPLVVGQASVPVSINSQMYA